MLVISSDLWPVCTIFQYLHFFLQVQVYTLCTNEDKRGEEVLLELSASESPYGHICFVRPLVLACNRWDYGLGLLKLKNDLPCKSVTRVLCPQSQYFFRELLNICCNKNDNKLTILHVMHKYQTMDPQLTTILPVKSTRTFASKILINMCTFSSNSYLE